MGIGDLIDAAASVWQVPDVEADRCVHSRLETASCRRCLAACPAQAWIMDDETLGIDMEACDGCGLCAPACPEGAILSDYSPDIRGWRGETIAFAACEYALSQAVSGRLPCVHAIGLTDLIRLHRRGVSRLVVSRGDCTGCSRHTEDTLDLRVSEINRLLLQRKRARMMIVSLDGDQWREFRELAEDHSQPELSRRDFLRKAAATTVDQAVSKSYPGMSGAEEYVPPGVLLPRGAIGEPSFFVPLMDADRCNGCDACTRVCPHAAIALGEGRDAYRMDADSCTGCGLCVDVCDQGAIQILPWAAQEQVEVPLARRRCSGCGVDFHLPAAQNREEPLCRICKKTGHFRNLFQVMS